MHNKANLTVTLLFAAFSFGAAASCVSPDADSVPVEDDADKNDTYRFQASAGKAFTNEYVCTEIFSCDVKIDVQPCSVRNRVGTGMLMGTISVAVDGETRYSQEIFDTHNDFVGSEISDLDPEATYTVSWEPHRDFSAPDLCMDFLVQNW